jgi:EamA domain-containing membrane protein RarD
VFGETLTLSRLLTYLPIWAGVALILWNCLWPAERLTETRISARASRDDLA